MNNKKQTNTQPSCGGPLRAQKYPVAVVRGQKIPENTQKYL